MSRQLTADSDIKALLRSANTIAVVGLSERQSRPSFGVAKYLMGVGYEVIPVNPHISEWQGIQAYPTVAAAGRKVDLVDVFRRPDFVMDTVEDGIAAGVGAFWTQLGVVNDEATECAVSAGIPIVVDRCTAIEHRRLIAGAGLSS